MALSVNSRSSGYSNSGCTPSRGYMRVTKSPGSISGPWNMNSQSVQAPLARWRISTRTQVEDIAPEVRQGLLLVEPDDTHIRSVAMRGGKDADGRSPDDISYDALLQLSPLLLHLDEERLELVDGLFFLVQFGLGRPQVAGCLLVTGICPLRVCHNLSLQHSDSVLQGTNLGLNGHKEAIESFFAHQHDLLLRCRGYVKL